MNILVLCGGSSSERNISITCGSNVCRALRENGHNAVLVDVMSDVELDIFEKSADRYHMDSYVESYREKNELIQMEMEKKTLTEFVGSHLLELAKKADLVFPVLHGVNGEDGKLQAMFELYGIKYTGAGSLSSALSLNKTLSKLVVKNAGVPVADGVSIFCDDYNANPSKYTLKELGLPDNVIVKPESGGSSIGTTAAYGEEEFRKSLETAFKYDDYVLAERFIHGREFSVGIVGGRAFPAAEIVVKPGEFYDYTNKYSNLAKEICPAELSEEEMTRLQNTALLAAKALRINSYCRIDCLMDEQKTFYFMEVNNLPGMSPKSLIGKGAAAAGISFNELCEMMVETALEKR